MVLTDDTLSRERAYQLTNEEHWLNLYAVSRGKAYLVEEMGWNFGDAHSSLLLLDKLPALLLG
ncbi:hypothetical protein D3C75_1289790 [compost metagenome]